MATNNTSEDTIMNCATGKPITIDEAHTLAADPPHLKDDNAPCFSCGMKWRHLSPGGARSISHSNDCIYWMLLLRGDA